ncbi:Transport protein Avl9 [Nesidiocoris tenuis]|uniref:Transport protein Avl9 n=1 Tax=Nesidiocoris tenuis TaxID=355587 RepID=A0ABN7BIY4_9HEMI|nr:Transport protein Avl9 [Nesidiocoris tenuis]
MDASEKGPILHVLVIGFHHKKGCQVEYSYPPLMSGGAADSPDTPSGWKYLPTLALPDGSHNYDKDTVFFHLPSLVSADETVFGISCFRQIPVEKLKVRTPDMTRGTVQKAVCVLSTVPLYGQIQVKMELITHAYFEEGDFTKVNLLQDTYLHLNACIQQMGDLNSSSQLFVGLSARELILALRHKVLLLYKLLLLEKKVLFFQSPVHPLCSSILSLLSLHPGMIEKGLSQSACFKPSRPMSPVPQFSATSPAVDVARNMDGDPGVRSVSKTPPSRLEDGPRMLIVSPSEPLPSDDLASSMIAEAKPANDSVPVKGGIVTVGREVKEGSPMVVDDGALAASMGDGNADEVLCNGDSEDGQPSQGPPESSISRDQSMDLLAGDASYQAAMSALSDINCESCALPLSIFAEGYLCLPYLSLPYMDVLTDPNISGYILGATNVLFKQKKNVADVIVELETGIIETADPDLKRMLHLSTEDLRFGEYLDRRTRTTDDAYTDGVGWEGGGEWIRTQFHAYTLALLRTSILPEGSKEMDQFNRWYMSAFMETKSYKRWRSHPDHRNILEAVPGHPFAGQLSVADMKLRISHTMQTTEGGRKLNQAMASTGRVVATTGRAVGGALSQAKGAFSSWWSNLTTSPTLAQAADSNADEAEVADAPDASDEAISDFAPPVKSESVSVGGKTVEQAVDALSCRTVGESILQA